MPLTPHQIGLLAVGVVFIVALVPFVAGWRKRARVRPGFLSLPPIPQGPGEGLRLSETASRKIRAVVEESRIAGAYVFVFVTPGGIAGSLYHVDLRSVVECPIPGAAVLFVSQGIPIVCDAESYRRGNLEGATIDWSSKQGGGFWFDSPKIPRPF